MPLVLPTWSVRRSSPIKSNSKNKIKGGKMPRTSKRQKLIRNLASDVFVGQQWMEVELITEEKDDDDLACVLGGGSGASVDSDDSVGTTASFVDAAIATSLLHEELDAISSSRYLERGPYRKSEFSILEEDLNVDADYHCTDQEFREKYRCSRRSLNFIAEEISDHRVFSNQRGPDQAPPIHQLMVLLHYMGHEGMTNSGQHSAFRIGHGTCEIYRDRAREAVLSLRDKYYYWPCETERRQIANRYKEEYSCPNCIGQQDGTLIEIAFQPQTEDSGDYHGRKLQWSLTVLIIGDDKGRIRYHLAGFPGCSHDNRVWKWSKIYRNKEQYFSELQYLLGDTAYEPDDVIIPTFKSDDGNGNIANPKKMLFNQVVGTPRVIMEHINGRIKGRLPGVMRKLRMIIDETEDSMKKILEYIECAVILHNIFIEIEDGKDEDEDFWQAWAVESDELSRADDPDRQDPDSGAPYEDVYVSPEESLMNSPLPFGHPKDLRRRQLCNYINEHHIRGRDEYDSDDMSEVSDLTNFDEAEYDYLCSNS